VFKLQFVSSATVSMSLDILVAVDFFNVEGP